MPVASRLEWEVAALLNHKKIAHQREYRFAPPRKWRADFFIPPNIILEVEGGAWKQGRHTRGSGFTADIVKYNKMAEMGFRLFRCARGRGDYAPTVVVEQVAKLLQKEGCVSPKL